MNQPVIVLSKTAQHALDIANRTLLMVVSFKAPDQPLNLQAFASTIADFEKAAKGYTLKLDPQAQAFTPAPKEADKRDLQYVYRDKKEFIASTGNPGLTLDLDGTKITIYESTRSVIADCVKAKRAVPRLSAVQIRAIGNAFKSGMDKIAAERESDNASDESEETSAE